MRRTASKLVLSLSVVVSLAFASITPTFAAENAVQEQEKMMTVGTVKTTSTNLNVRASAGATSKIVGKLPNKATIIIKETQDKWHYITYGTTKGWVSSDYIVNIQQKEGSTVSRSADRDSLEKAQDIIQFAMTLVGKPYKSGGSSPKGFDCSGFVTYVFNNAGVSVPRSSTDYPEAGQAVSREELLPGDIICSDTSGSINGGISHVAIYMGNGNFIHASSGSKKIMIDNLSEEYYDKRYVCAVRILN